MPDKREITPNGFTATWNVLAVNRNFPQEWTDKQNIYPDYSDFGISLLIPVDHYQLSTRSVKYAIMFIALTFAIYLFIEAIAKKRIHVIQYVLVGLALLIFYSLLLSLSEHLGFNMAYLISAVAIIGMITAYSHGSFKNIRLTALLTAILAILYIFLFTILQLQDFSLLLGSIGLFIVLAIFMALSRKIDWYV